MFVSKATYPPYAVLVFSMMLPGWAQKSGSNQQTYMFSFAPAQDATTGANKLFLNPGECCGWVHGKCTAAILDTEALAAEIIEVTV